MSLTRTALLHSKSTRLLLVVAILFTALVPVHYHLHHVHGIDAHGHEHTIDLHLVTASADQSHDHDDATSIFAATPDVIVKKIGFDVFPCLLLAGLLVTGAIYSRSSARPSIRATRYKQHARYFSPQLRAPPAS